MASIHQFRIEALTGEEIDFAEFAGKKLMMVNVASACGFTPQYLQLQDLYDHFYNRLVIVGMPCDDFGKQEPGNEDEIRSFCDLNFGISFPMTKKVNIVSDTHPIFEWLCDKRKNTVLNCEVSWNFQKFLLDEEGRLCHVVAPAVEPASEKILSWISSS